MKYNAGFAHSFYRKRNFSASTSNRIDNGKSTLGFFTYFSDAFHHKKSREIWIEQLEYFKSYFRDIKQNIVYVGKNKFLEKNKMRSSILQPQIYREFFANIQYGKCYI